MQVINQLEIKINSTSFGLAVDLSALQLSLVIENKQYRFGKVSWSQHTV